MESRLVELEAIGKTVGHFLAVKIDGISGLLEVFKIAADSTISDTQVIRKDSVGNPLSDVDQVQYLYEGADFIRRFVCHP